MVFTDTDTAGVREQSGTYAVDLGYLRTRLDAKKDIALNQYYFYRPERIGNSAHVQAAVLSKSRHILRGLENAEFMMRGATAQTYRESVGLSVSIETVIGV